MRWWNVTLTAVVTATLAACAEPEEERLIQPTPPAEVFVDDLPGQIFTRGPDGEVVTEANYDAPEDVFLFGTGLPDGKYYFGIVDYDCTRLLAGPDPVDRDVPDTAGRPITVKNGVFGEFPLAPFLPLEKATDYYRVYATPATEFGAETGTCFGFHRLASVTTIFLVNPTAAPPQTPPRPSPVEPRQ